MPGFSRANGDVVGKLAVLHVVDSFATPTNALRVRMQMRYGQRIDLDTCHTAFGFSEDQQYCPSLAIYNLVVIDEGSQLQGWHYKRISKLRDMADRVPVILTISDKYQIAGHGEERIWHTPQWARNTCTQ